MKIWLVFVVGGVTIVCICDLLLLGILGLVAVMDYRCFKVRNSAIAMILIIAFIRMVLIDLSIYDLIKRGVICVILVLMYFGVGYSLEILDLKRYRVGKTIGGADVKIALALVITLGFWECMWVLLLGGVVCVIDVFLERICLEKTLRQIPLGVFIFSGYLLVFALNVGGFKV